MCSFVALSWVVSLFFRIRTATSVCRDTGDNKEWLDRKINILYPPFSGLTKVHLTCLIKGKVSDVLCKVSQSEVYKQHRECEASALILNRGLLGGI